MRTQILKGRSGRKERRVRKEDPSQRNEDFMCESSRKSHQDDRFLIKLGTNFYVNKRRLRTYYKYNGILRSYSK